MKYEAVIGLETHVQLKTRSKMFGTSSADYQTAEPNTVVDEVSMALPGTLPVVNQTAVEYAMMIGMAINCNIARITKFDRKNYTYPDLMKGYQITQMDEPICYEGMSTCQSTLQLEFGSTEFTWKKTLQDSFT